MPDPLIPLPACILPLIVRMIPALSLSAHGCILSLIKVPFSRFPLSGLESWYHARGSGWRDHISADAYDGGRPGYPEVSSARGGLARPPWVTKRDAYRRPGFASGFSYCEELRAGPSAECPGPAGQAASIIVPIGR